MKKIFTENFTTSIRADSTKGIPGISELFSTGVDCVLISCISGDNFYLCDPSDLQKKINPGNHAGLEEILSNFKDKKIIIEIYGKNDKSDELSGIIKKHSMSENVLIWTQNSNLMKKIRQKLPDTATAMTPNEFVYLYFLFKTGFLYFKKKFTADCLISIESAGISYILNHAMLRELAKREIFSIALVDSTGNQIKRLIDSGCRGFVLKDAMQFQNVKDILKPV